MKKQSPYVLSLAVLLSWVMATPPESWAAPQGTKERAGEVSRVIPAVAIERGTQKITASNKSVVDWQDLVNTQVNGRARIALDDGSLLNVGSESSMRIVKHDAGAQQTELELTYGKIRSQAQKITKPDGKFEVHTPAGVAGVVGTDFYVGYDNGVMNVLVFEGIVKVCNLAGVCVMVKAGQMTNVRNGDSSGPQPPTQASLDLLVAAGNATSVGAPGLQSAVNAGTHIGKGTAITLGVLAAIPAIVVPVVATRKGTATPVTNCQTNPNGQNCG